MYLLIWWIRGLMDILTWISGKIGVHKWAASDNKWENEVKELEPCPIHKTRFLIINHKIASISTISIFSKVIKIKDRIEMIKIKLTIFRTFLDYKIILDKTYLIVIVKNQVKLLLPKRLTITKEVKKNIRWRILRSQFTSFKKHILWIKEKFTNLIFQYVW